MSLDKITNDELNGLKKEYNLLDMKIIQHSNMLIIVIKIPLQDLSDNWKPLSSELSEYTEEFIDTSFQRWNVYIIYATSDTVNKELKYKIENNTFFARKIVEDNYSVNLTDANIEKLINEHILFKDLELSSGDKKGEEYIPKLNLDFQDDSMDLDNVKNILNNLEKGIKNEI